MPSCPPLWAIGDRLPAWRVLGGGRAGCQDTNRGLDWSSGVSFFRLLFCAHSAHACFACQWWTSCGGFYSAAEELVREEQTRPCSQEIPHTSASTTTEPDADARTLLHILSRLLPHTATTRSPARIDSWNGRVLAFSPRTAPRRDVLRSTRRKRRVSQVPNIERTSPPRRTPVLPACDAVALSRAALEHGGKARHYAASHCARYANTVPRRPQRPPPATAACRLPPPPNERAPRDEPKALLCAASIAPSAEAVAISAQGTSALSPACVHRVPSRRRRRPCDSPNTTRPHLYRVLRGCPAQAPTHLLGCTASPQRSGRAAARCAARSTGHECSSPKWRGGGRAEGNTTIPRAERCCVELGTRDLRVRT
ncbi:hypothetical protein C2E23DRAFT_376622 [Lenzites betulinus]|nr:hypothetical protein C2E23DRAFT_376622 [Lenzites betulinus]